MYENPLTTDLSKMDLEEVNEILTTYQGTQYQRPQTTTAFKAMWIDDEVCVTLNQESGYHFLTNSEYQVAMPYDGKLSMFINCGECGREDFEQDWVWTYKDDHDSSKCEGCKEIVKMLKECEE